MFIKSMVSDSSKDIAIFYNNISPFYITLFSDSATKPLPILVYTLYLHFLADFTAKFGEWMRLTSQAILITNTSSSSSSSATRLAECIRQAAIHTLGRLNEIHETTKLGVSGITSDDDVVLVDTVTTQMDLDVEACVAQVQDILGMVAKVLTASLLKQGGNNTKICDNESVTNAAAAAFSPSKSPSTAAPSTSTTSLTDDSSLHQKKSSLVSPITTDSVAIPVESSLDSRVGGEGEGDGEEEGETTPTAATSAQSQLAVTATVAAAVKPNKKLE